MKFSYCPYCQNLIDKDWDGDYQIRQCDRCGQLMRFEVIDEKIRARKVKSEKDLTE